LEKIVENTASEPFDLGIWIGRHQAFALIANFCSAADAHALLTIREQKLYRSKDLTWDEFCSRYAGISRTTAERIIAHLEEFGDSYFHLTEIVPLPAAEYRALQPAIEDNAIEFEGRRIPIDLRHAEELTEAVRTLRDRLQKERQRTTPSELTELQKLLDRAAGQIAGVVRRAEDADRSFLVCMVDDYVSRVMDGLNRALREADSA
jgi:hypothetical protein